MAELWKNRFGGGSRDTVGRRFEGHGLAEVYRDSLAKVRERQLGEGSRETARRRFERDSLVPISIPRCEEKRYKHGYKGGYKIWW